MATSSTIRGHIVSSKAILVSILTAMAVVGAVVAIAWNDLPGEAPDSDHYIELAKGNSQNVEKPYSQRILHPFVVRVFSKLTGATVEQGFLASAVTGLIVLSVGIPAILGLSGYRNFFILPLLLTPFLIQLFTDYYLHDLFHAALVATFFVGLRYKPWVALIMLLPLYLTRESTFVLALCLLAFALHHRDWRFSVSVVLISAAGLGMVFIAGDVGQSNIHQMATPVYASLKVPFNFLRNVLGLPLWANTITYCSPVWESGIPGWLPLGSVHSIGLCNYDYHRPVTTLAELLTIFGIAPSVVLYAALLSRARFKRTLMNLPLWLGVAITYGSVSFVIGTSIGPATSRLIGYGWPVFWIVVPIILMQVFNSDRRVFALLVLLHVLTGWLFLLLKSPYDTTVTNGIIAGGALVGHLLAWQALRKTWSPKCLRPLEGNFYKF